MARRTFSREFICRYSVLGANYCGISIYVSILQNSILLAMSIGGGVRELTSPGRITSIVRLKCFPRIPRTRLGGSTRKTYGRAVVGHYYLNHRCATAQQWTVRNKVKQRATDLREQRSIRSRPPGGGHGRRFDINKNVRNIRRRKQLRRVSILCAYSVTVGVARVRENVQREHWRRKVTRFVLSTTNERPIVRRAASRTARREKTRPVCPVRKYEKRRSERSRGCKCDRLSTLANRTAVPRTI